MTTSADPAPTPVDPSSSEYAELWRAIGRLEGTAAALLEGQRDLKEGQQELRAEFHAGHQELRAEIHTGLREVNRRVDRLFYATLAVGGALMVTVLASRLIEG